MKSLITAFTLISVSLHAQDTAGLDIADLKGRPYSPNTDLDYPAEVYFGETHVHSALSTDAGGGGTTLMPRDIYRFARGEELMSNTGQPMKLARPLDFVCLTEHTDGMGVITDILKGTPTIMADEQGKKYHDAFNAGGDAAKAASLDIIKQFGQGTLSKTLVYQPGNPGYDRTWADLVAAAEEYNEPHEFTALISYEWTSMVKGNNLHRNVILRDGPERALQVLPFTMTPPEGSPNPRDLWKWLQNYEATTGPRIKLRFFGGFEFTADDAKARDIATVGYAKGVPMGGDIDKAAEGKSPPSSLPPCGIPRWTAYDAVRFNITFPNDVPLKTQERAYTSPIWHTP